MGNTAYYKFENDFIAVIKAADPETLRGALAGVIKWSFNANFNRALYHGLCNGVDPQSDLRKALDALEVA